MSNNETPEQQAAYKLQLQAQIDMYDKEIEFLSLDLQNHQYTIEKYERFETQHQLFRKLVDVMIQHTKTGMLVIRNEIQEYQEYRAKAFAEFQQVNPQEHVINP